MWLPRGVSGDDGAPRVRLEERLGGGHVLGIAGKGRKGSLSVGNAWANRSLRFMDSIGIERSLSCPEGISGYALWQQHDVGSLERLRVALAARWRAFALTAHPDKGFDGAAFARQTEEYRKLKKQIMRRLRRLRTEKAEFTLKDVARQCGLKVDTVYHLNADFIGSNAVGPEKKSDVLRVARILDVPFPRVRSVFSEAVN